MYIHNGIVKTIPKMNGMHDDVNVWLRTKKPTLPKTSWIDAHNIRVLIKLFEFLL